MTPTQIVQHQLDAYNARDLDAFVACYSEDVRIFRMPEEAPALVGRDALRAFYAEHRFSNPGLHAELLNRIAIGATVIDHERVHGLGDAPLEVAAVYRIVEAAAGGLITEVRFFYP